MNIEEVMGKRNLVGLLAPRPQSSESQKSPVLLGLIKNCLCSRFVINDIYAELFVKIVFRLFLLIKLLYVSNF